MPIPDISAFQTLLTGTDGREMSTTMAFVRLLNTLARDPRLRKHIVPIVADEARTFGMEGMFRQLGIYSSVGQLYRPVDAGQIAPYHEAKDGQMLQEGICEAGALCSWMAAGTAYSNHGIQMIPFYIFYSMFGFQRVGDLVWADADMQARGFLIGGTSGRTTLNGEGLQHADGHSHVLASTVPNCVAYDPTFAYELVVIIHDGLRRMYENQENVFYYVTTMNENYAQPPMPAGVEAAIRRGMYLLRAGADGTSPAVQLLGCGTILRECLAAADLLQRFGVGADVWSVTSFHELRRDGLSLERRNRLHPEAAPEVPYVTQCLGARTGPVVAATDYMKSFPDAIRAFVPRRYVTLGTDGFGRSDTRPALRRFFEVDRHHIAVAALKALSDEGAVPASRVTEAIRAFDIDPDAPDPTAL